MRRLVLGLLFALSPAGAEPPPRGPRIDAIVPVDPREHERLHFFGRRNRPLVPGTVTINGDPYRCDLDDRRFRDEEDFVAHLRGQHRVPERRIPDLLVVRDGLVHFIGE